MSSPDSAAVGYYGSPRPSAPSELDVATTVKVSAPTGICMHCSAPSQPFLCWSCVRMLRRQLVEVPWLLRRLHESAYGEAKVARKGGPRVSTGERLPSLPLNTRAADVMRDAARLVRWSEQVAGLSARGAVTPDACEAAARWLASEPGRMMMHPWAPDALRWVLQWRADAERAIDLPPDTQYAGPCQEPRTEDVIEQGVVVRTIVVGRCGTPLYVDAEALVVDCPRCGSRWDVSVLQRQALERVDDRPRTAADMWRLFKFLGRDVPRSSFYRLMTSVESTGELSADGLPLFTYGSVSAALDARDAAEVERRAAGKVKRGRPRKRVSVDSATLEVVPSASPDQATG